MKSDLQKNCLITSGQYIGDELEAEFGRIPPAFLPIGHECLYVEQLRLLRSWGVKNVYLSIPNDFDCTPYHLAELERLGVNLLFMPNYLSLGEAVARALGEINEHSNLLIMHGDTLFAGALPEINDFVSVDIKPVHYRWGSPHLISEGDIPLVLTGLFHFKNKNDLLGALAETKYNFFDAISLLLEKHLTYTKIDGWLDFGHLQTYYHSKNYIKINRNFNELTFYKNRVVKSSTNKKIISEALWYEKIPEYLRLYTSTYLGRTGDNGYELANEVLPTLHDLYIFSRLDSETWALVADSISGYLRLCYNDKDRSTPIIEKAERNYQDFILEKSISRISEWADKGGVDLKHEWIINGEYLPSIESIIGYCKDEIISKKINFKHGIMHGDLCFTNIFYDSRTQLIKTIDPRGYVFEGEDSIYGFLQYDLAKINHSLSGYDEILAGRYSYRLVEEYHIEFQLNFDPYRECVKDIFSNICILDEKIDSPSVEIITILLFISLIPLHGDNKSRQDAFIANAILLYAQYVRKNDSNSNGR